MHRVAITLAKKFTIRALDVKIKIPEHTLTSNVVCTCLNEDASLYQTSSMYSSIPNNKDNSSTLVVLKKERWEKKTYHSEVIESN